MARRYADPECGITTNDWSVHIEENGQTVLDETVKNATKDQEKEFKAKVFQHVTSPKDECKAPGTAGETVGSLQWYGGPLAMRMWSLQRCKACGGIHGRLTMMA